MAGEFVVFYSLIISTQTLKKYIFIFLLSIFSIQFQAQEILFEKKVNKSIFSGNNNNIESLPIVDSVTKQIALFLIDKNTIYGFQFNKNYELQNNYITKKTEKKYTTLLGYSKDKTSYNLFFTDKKNKHFYSKSINFINKSNSETIYDIKLKDELFLSSINQNNQFYLLTVKKSSSLLIIRVFSGSHLSQTETIDLSFYKLYKPPYSNLSSILLSDEATFRLDLSIQKIDSNSPSSLEITSKKNKLYSLNNSIYITLNNTRSNTKLISIDLSSFDFKVQLFNNGVVDCSDNFRVKSNSFLHNNTLFQIKGCAKELYFTIYDISSEKLLKDYRVTKDEEIIFKNSALIYKGDIKMFGGDSEKELDNTAQILRKISKSNMALSVNETSSFLEVTIGGFKEVSRGGGGGMMMHAGGGMSTIGGGVTFTPTYHYNPVMYGYNSYSNSKQAHFKTLLNKSNFTHLKEKTYTSTIDKIDTFRDKNEESQNIFQKISPFDQENDFITKTIFKVDDYFVFGYYDKTEKKYYLRKFLN